MVIHFYSKCITLVLNSRVFILTIIKHTGLTVRAQCNKRQYTIHTWDLIFNFFNILFVHFISDNRLTHSGHQWLFCNSLETILVSNPIQEVVLLHLSLNPKGVLFLVKSDDILAHSFHLFSSLETLAWFWHCAFDCYHAGFRSLELILSGSILVYPLAFMVPPINVISPTLFELNKPHIIMLPPPCFTVRSMVIWPYCGHTGLVHTKLWTPSWSHLTKEWAPQYSSGFLSVL